MFSCSRLALCCALLLPLLPRAAELVVLVDTATEMPMARFEQYRLVDGIHKDVGEALAQAMGRQPRFVALPRKRIGQALHSGTADVLCGYMPEWLDRGPAWSQPFFPMVEVVITDRAARRPRTVADLAGQPVGTVFGYAYPKLERALGRDFRRADGPSTELNLRKLAAGRLQHVVTMKSIIDYRVKLDETVLVLHPPLVVTTWATRCAVSPKGRVSVAEVDHAVARMVHDGAVARITARYQ
jgi:ABC-type amino acid transport substrate-binding protein